jgi:hypothetical protein
VDRARHAQPARLRALLEAGGDVDAVAVEAVAVDQDVADVDADAELHPPPRRPRPVQLRQRPLDPDRGPRRADRALEVGHEAVARDPERAAAEIGHDPADRAARLLELGQRPLVVLLHEARVARRVGGEDDGELALGRRRPRRGSSVRPHGFPPARRRGDPFPLRPARAAT